MNTKLFVTILLPILLCGCIGTPKTMNEIEVDWLAPEQAIFAAAKYAPNAIHCTIHFTVRAAEEQDGIIYLNSEKDYRDQRNVSIALLPNAQLEVGKIYGKEAKEFFLNKTVAVEGLVQRVTIIFTVDGRPSEKFYYQTQIPVQFASQLSLIE